MTENNSKSGPGETPRRTPLQTRPYFNMPHMTHGMQSPQNHSGTRSPNMIQQTNSALSDDTGIIYGTNISSKTAMASLQRFIQQFSKLVEIDGETHEQKAYMRQLLDLDMVESTTFTVQGMDLKQWDRELYYQFIYFPAQMISCFDMTIKLLYEKHFISELIDEATVQQKRQRMDRLMVGITKLDQYVTMRDLGPKQINKLISFKGITIRCSEIYPQMKRAVFRCNNCKAQTFVELQNAKVQQPSVCTQCRQKETLEMVHNLCQFTDKQYVKFQQLPENVPEGQTPNSLTLICYDTNVDGIRPGDRIQVIGIYRAQSVKMQKNKAAVKSVFNTYVDLISFKIVEDNRYKAANGILATNFTEEEKNEFYEIASKPTVIDDLINSFAPSIYGNEEVKKGILAQIFGGANKDFSQSGRGRFRSDINICLVGDPSTAKSQLLQQVYKIAPRGIYTSGRGSSAVGLTANVKKDPETKQFVLESGALVLSDLGICCIDQFDKMDENNRTILLEAMQQQTISIAKAGIVCQLNSRTSILCAANPINSRYDPKKSIVENIHLNPALITRFDLIYILLDNPDQLADRRLANHILSIYSDKKQSEARRPTIERNVLTKYITFARQYVTPKLSQEGADLLVKAYTTMRKMGNSQKVITATPRQLESMIRISEAFAKMRLSNVVSADDVDMAIRLIQHALQKSATDPETGLIDMNILATGKTTSTRKRIEEIANLLKNLFKSNESKFKKVSRIYDLKQQLERIWQSNKQTIKQNEVYQALQLLQTQDYVALIGVGQHKKQFKLTRNLADH